MRRIKENIIPLIIERHPEDYEGYPFITLIQQSRRTFLTIVDNMERNTLNTFILDLCVPEEVNEKQIIEVATVWYEYSRDKYPISIEFSKKGLTLQTSKIYRTFNVEYISRIIGPVPNFPMTTSGKVRRKKKKIISNKVEKRDKIYFHENINFIILGNK